MMEIMTVYLSVINFAVFHLFQQSISRLKEQVDVIKEVALIDVDVFETEIAALVRYYLLKLSFHFHFQPEMCKYATCSGMCSLMFPLSVEFLFSFSVDV